MDDCSLNKVNSSKYLRVIIDHKLNWIYHIAYIKTKISKAIDIMHRARSIIHIFILLIILKPEVVYQKHNYILCFYSKNNNTYNDVFALPSTHRTYF